MLSPEILAAPPLNSSNQATRYQYDQNPYPEIPLDRLPNLAKQPALIAKCNFTTPYYLRNRYSPNLSQCKILDVGCGSGWKTLAIALANPEAQVLGIDFSAASIQMASDRAAHHHLSDRVQFQRLSLEDLQTAQEQFEMIHCDEVLYLIQDPLLCLTIFEKLLKPNGVIRANFHSLRQRHYFYQAQDFLREIDLFHETTGDLEIEIIQDIFQSLKEDVVLKQRTFKNSSPEEIRMNLILQGDRGFTIPQTFTLLRSANLEYIQMLDWPTWDFQQLFQKTEELPDYLTLSLSELDLESTLNLYDILNPIHRLIDFWCGSPLQPQTTPPLPQDWTTEDWKIGEIQFHPLLRTDEIQQKFLNALSNLQPFQLSEILPIVSTSVSIQPHLAACLLPLFTGTQPLSVLVDRYFKLYPLNPFTNVENTLEDVLNCLIPSLLDLEKFTYILMSLPH